MAAFKSFKSLVQLQHQEGTLFKVVGDSSKVPKWFHPEHLDDPETVYVDAWLVEKMFGKDGEYIPHVECVTRTVLHVNQWNPEEEAEILIFGPPDYQKDVSQMIWNLVDYFCKQVIQEEDCSQETETQCLPVAVREAATQPAPVENTEAATHLAPVKEADATQLAPVEDTDAVTQLGPVAVHEEASEAVTIHTMAARKSFKSFVQLQQQEGNSFKVVGDSSKLPEWFHPYQLDDPETVYVDAWLVEKMFGKDGEYIPHVECVTRTVLHVNQWNPEGEAEILIFGPPDYQKDVSQLIWNLADYFCKQVIQKEHCSQETKTRRLPVRVRESASQLPPWRLLRPPPNWRLPWRSLSQHPQPSPVENAEAATQLAAVEVRVAATQQASVEVPEAAPHLSPVEDAEDAHQLSPVQDAEAATQVSPVEHAEAATQQSPVEDAEAAIQLALVGDAEAFTDMSPLEDAEAFTQLAPVEVGDAATQLGPVAVHEEASEGATMHTEVHQDVTKPSAIEVCEAATPPSSTLWSSLWWFLPGVGVGEGQGCGDVPREST
ncbi:KH domain-containing protein 3-like [Peromyscus eremicus]|uniref:KH domain-containing protein 3-like n=1 Tax=Peromyscus eremicus TaxID=42410 RepID=UPI0027DE9990|nr:KH domain-containing protein 3-like [Peromyscus eremicus]